MGEMLSALKDWAQSALALLQARFGIRVLNMTMRSNNRLFLAATSQYICLIPRVMVDRNYSL